MAGEDGEGCKEAEACHVGEHALQTLALHLHCFMYLHIRGDEVVDSCWILFHPKNYRAQDNQLRSNKEEGIAAMWMVHVDANLHVLVVEGCTEEGQSWV